MSWLDEVKFGADGLVPVIAQEAGTKEVLMHAWMDRAALARTAETRVATYWSRSRRKLWTKGEESGNVQKVREVRLDCDRDTVLLVVEQTSAVPGEPAIACHTGRHACFFDRLEGERWETVEPVLKDPAAIYR
jgi:phosphoribosyl-AMP cyclohydrolase